MSVHVGCRGGLARLAVVIGVLGVPALVSACSVPVFRYALQHWAPDEYQVFVYHEGDLATAERDVLAAIEAGRAAGANVRARSIDLATVREGPDVVRWRRAGEPTPPSLLVHLPDRGGRGDVAVGAAAASGAEGAALLASPARNELASRLVAGEIVWVFLESGRREDDDRLFDLLASRLEREQENIRHAGLPAGAPDAEPSAGPSRTPEEDADDRAAAAALGAVSFTTLRVRRDDPAERWFVRMLLSVEPDLRDETIVGQPMVFPIFGQGRALYALVGAGISGDLIAEAAGFLTGACQCTVKAENPGVDLLLAVNWADAVPLLDDEEPSEVPLSGLSTAMPVQTRTAALPPDTVSPADSVPTQSSATTPEPMLEPLWPASPEVQPSILRSVLPIVAVLFALAAGTAVVRRGWRRDR